MLVQQRSIVPSACKPAKTPSQLYVAVWASAHTLVVGPSQGDFEHLVNEGGLKVPKRCPLDDCDLPRAGLALTPKVSGVVPSPYTLYTSVGRAERGAGVEA